MMTREQRIQYEILDSALNRAIHREGFITTVILFMRRLEELFPDIGARDLKEACQGLMRLGAIEISFAGIGGYRYYQGADDDAALFDAKTLRFTPTSFSQAYYRQLSALIEMPRGLKRPGGVRP